jgi:D-amino-acid oxidase
MWTDGGDLASRKGGPRIEVERAEKWSVPVVHCYGHAGAGYQSSW